MFSISIATFVCIIFNVVYADKATGPSFDKTLDYLERQMKEDTIKERAIQSEMPIDGLLEEQERIKEEKQKEKQKRKVNSRLNL